MLERTRKMGAPCAFLITCLMFLVPAMTALGGLGPSGDQGHQQMDPDRILDLLAKGDGLFIENRGQWSEDIQFVTRTSFGLMAFGRGYILFDIREGVYGPEPKGMEEKGSLVRGTVIVMRFDGPNYVTPRGSGPIISYTNIIHGKDPSKWGTSLATYGKIEYTDLWDGIDLVVSSKAGSIKYDYVVRPYADTGAIRFEVIGPSSVTVNDGSIEMTTFFGSLVRDAGLVSYYKGSPSETVKTSFYPNDDGTIGFRTVGRDPSRTLVIDPVIYSTFIGGSDSEGNLDMMVDGDGACFIAGCTYSFDLKTTPGAYSTASSGEMDGYVMKIYPNGSAPEFSTYIGGSSSEYISSMFLDKDGNVHIAGSTTSSDFPTTDGAFNETQYGIQSDIVVAKIGPTGADLLFSTYVGGDGPESMETMGSLKVDGSGHVYFAATSWSSNFPVTDDAYDKYNNGTWRDEEFIVNGKVVLVKLSPDGSDLEYSTYIGGSSWDSAYALELDQYGMVYIMGATSSDDFPVTEKAFDNIMDAWSTVFVLKFDIASSTILYATFLEGQNYQVGKDLIVDSEGRAFVVGETGSIDFPVTRDCYQSFLSGWADIFVTAFDPTGSSLYVSTLLGGSSGDQGNGINFDPDGNILVTGSTWSSDYPMLVVNKDDASDADPDAVISVLDPMCKELLYSTVVGGRGVSNNYPEDKGIVIIHHAWNRVIVAGYTGSTDFPVSDDAWDTIMLDNNDHFLMEFDISLPPSAPRNISIERGDGAINVTWDLPETDGGMPITGFIVMKGDTEDDLRPLKVRVEDLFFNDTELVAGTTYYYVVNAQNGVGMGPPSDMVSARAATSPTQPQFFQLSKGDGQVVLTWEPPVFDGACVLEGYRVYKVTEGEGTLVIDLDPYSFRLTDEDVMNGRNYSYRMTAWNVIGESSPTQELWVIPSGKPSPPSGLSVVNGPDSVLLSWDPPADDGGAKVLFYRVHIGTRFGSETVWRYADSSGCQFMDPFVEIGRTYLYRVTAVNGEGESAPSNEVEGIPQSEPSTPESVELKEGNAFLYLTWEPPSFLGGIELQGYKVYRSVNGGEPLIVMELPNDVHSFNDKNVSNGISYTYSVSAFNDYGPSELTLGISGTPAGVPGMPTDVGARTSDGQVVIEWKAPLADGGAPITEHRIFRKTASGEFEQIASVPAGTLMYNDTMVELGGTYIYAVKAVNRMGASLYSDKVTLVVQMVPGTPRDISFAPGDGSVVISWGAPEEDGGSPITGYIILRKGAEDLEATTVSEPGPSVRSYKDVDVDNGLSYTYAVRAVNAMGTSIDVWSGPVRPVGRPGAPVSLVLKIKGAVVTLGWMPPVSDGGAGILLYRVYRSFEGGPMVLIGVVEAGMTLFVDSAPKEVGGYTYMVAAVNDAGEGQLPAQGSVKVKDENGSKDLIKDNMGLLITVPMIVILALLLTIVLVRNGRRKAAAVPVPVPSPVEGGIGPGADISPQENIMMFERSMDDEQ